MSSGSTTIEPGRSSQKPIAIWMLALFAGTSFLSAYLLFQVQLIVSKWILPWFGGSAAVWTTSMLVFQLLLLAGYTYSHLLSNRLSPGAQSRLHLGVLAAAFLLVMALSLFWPSAITPGADWKPQGSSHPVIAVSVILLVAAGLPFFVLSTTAPLLQRWFAMRGGDAATYRLYAVSNIGSLLGLLLFPFVLEPALRMTTQGRVWTLLFCAFLACCAWCAWGARYSTLETSRQESGASSTVGKTTVQARILWFLLPACASALLLAATNLICLEITSFPLLWVLPLALYLLSFILCFDHPRWYRREIFHPLLALGILAVCVSPNRPKLVITPLLLFVVCMVCHGELVKLKPHTRHLTSFYLSISAGGALGGVFVAIVAPQVFRFFTEFPISLAASLLLLLWCLALDANSWLYRMHFWMSAGVAAGIIAAAYAVSQWSSDAAYLISTYRFYPAALLAGALVLIGSFLHRPDARPRTREFLPGQVLVGLLALTLTAVLYRNADDGSHFYLSERNFYGVLHVDQQPAGKVLYHGSIAHGGQLNPPADRQPTLYYGPDSGIGILLRNNPLRDWGTGNLRIGVVGMGTGTLATYGIRGDYIRFYEIDPNVIALSQGASPVFTFVRDSAAKVDIELGDGRLLLERELQRGEPGNFDVLVLDAFSGDAIPVHLLTTEAFEMYWKHLNPEHGVIVINVSSRHINLLPVVEGTAKYFHGELLVRFHRGDFPYIENLWAIVARRPQDLQIHKLTAIAPPIPSGVIRPPRVWTDDYSDIMSLVY